MLTFFDNARAASSPVSLNVFFGGTVSQLPATGGSLLTDTSTNIYSTPAVTNVAAAGNATTPYSTVNVITPTTTSGMPAFVGSGNRALLFDNVSVAAAPEPSQSAALGLGVLGLAGLIFTARKRSRLSA